MYSVNVCTKGRTANKIKLKTNYKEQREEYDENVVCDTDHNHNLRKGIGTGMAQVIYELAWNS